MRYLLLLLFLVSCTEYRHEMDIAITKGVEKDTLHYVWHTSNVKGIYLYHDSYAAGGCYEIHAGGATTEIGCGITTAAIINYKREEIK